jgi:PhnB protein
MKNSIVFEFSVDKENKVIRVEREFAAPLAKVWAAWTQSEILDQWWAPKPWQTKTKSLDFREGGFWLYAMVGPDNTTQWCRADYKSIITHRSFSGYDAFCDENGNINRDFPRSLWTNQFKEYSDQPW